MALLYQQFQHKNATVGFLRGGNGPEPLLLFHGFGQDHTVFSALVNQVGETFTCFSFDLFFHGKSEWHLGERPLSKERWNAILTHFLLEHKIEKFSVLGFSLGGKFAMACLEAKPTQINAIFLLAPDGIKTSVWYSMATYPIALRYLFKNMIANPGLFLSLVKIAKALHLVDNGILRFAQSQMEGEAMRRRVYYSWVVFRHLKFNLDKIAHAINVNNVSTTILIGKFDKIITAKNMESFLVKMPNAKMHVLPAGHNGLIAESVKVLGKYEPGKGINSL